MKLISSMLFSIKQVLEAANGLLLLIYILYPTIFIILVIN